MRTLIGLSVPLILSLTAACEQGGSAPPRGPRATDAGAPYDASAREDAGPAEPPARDAGALPGHDAGDQPPREPGLPFPPPEEGRGESGEASSTPRIFSSVEVLGPRVVRFYFRGNSELPGGKHARYFWFRTYGRNGASSAGAISCGPHRYNPSITLQGFEADRENEAYVEYDDGTLSEPVSFRTAPNVTDTVGPIFLAVYLDTVEGRRSVMAEAVDDVLIDRIELYVDGGGTPIAVQRRGGICPFAYDEGGRRYEFELPAELHGEHTVMLRAVDEAGNHSDRSYPVTLD